MTGSTRRAAGAARPAFRLSCNSDLSDETEECRAAGCGSQSADSGQAGEYRISLLGIGIFPPRVKPFVLFVYSALSFPPFPVADNGK